MWVVFVFLDLSHHLCSSELVLLFHFEPFAVSCSQPVSLLHTSFSLIMLVTFAVSCSQPMSLLHTSFSLIMLVTFQLLFNMTESSNSFQAVIFLSVFLSDSFLVSLCVTSFRIFVRPSVPLQFFLLVVLCHWFVESTLFGDHVSLRLHWEFSLKFNLFN